MSHAFVTFATHEQLAAPESLLALAALCNPLLVVFDASTSQETPHHDSWTPVPINANSLRAFTPELDARWKETHEKDTRLNKDAPVDRTLEYKWRASKVECVLAAALVCPKHAIKLTWVDLGTNPALVKESPLVDVTSSTVVVRANAMGPMTNIMTGTRHAWTAAQAPLAAAFDSLHDEGYFVGHDAAAVARASPDAFLLFKDAECPRTMAVPKLIVELSCGLGNHLFQIAAGLTAAMQTGRALYLYQKKMPAYDSTFLHAFAHAYLSRDQVDQLLPWQTCYNEPHFHYAPIPASATYLRGFF